MKIKLIIATRSSEAEFFTATATGRSLAFNKPAFIEFRIFPNNKEGLPKLYNQVIRECAADPSMLIFIHDDLHFLDFYWISRVAEGLRNFKVIGVAGNIRRVSKQPSWAYIDTKLTWDKTANLSGAVGHGNGFPPRVLNVYGQPRQKVKLLDGMLLACESETLIKNNIFFDERFKFHFYDLDFCRQAEAKNISCGTWDLSLVHESKGGFGSESWKSAYQEYLAKWGG